MESQTPTGAVEAGKEKAVTEKMIDLKPCPFCGNKAELSHGKFDGKGTSYVCCTRCGATGEFFLISYDHASDDLAIAAWNKRTERREE